MSKEKHIEEMSKILESTCDNTECKVPFNCDLCQAKHLYNSGYRKQSEGEWILCQEKRPFGAKYYICSNCQSRNGTMIKFNYCFNCGAKMKGGEE